MSFVEDRESLLACVRRMCLDASATLKFDNADGTLRFDVHVECDAPDAVAAGAPNVFVEVFVLPPWVSDTQGFDDVIEDVLVAEMGPDYDDYACGYSVTTMQCDTTHAADVAPLADALNRMHRWCLCPCARRLVYDEAPMCLLCQATAKKGDAEVLEDACIICLQDCLAMHASRTACCRKVLHRLCALRHGQNDAKCPACRKRRASESSESESSESE